MLKDSYISVSELRTQTKKIFQKLKAQNKMFVMNNNKPTWVLLSVESYERLISDPNWVKLTKSEAKELENIKKNDDFLSEEEFFSELNK